MLASLDGEFDKLYADTDGLDPSGAVAPGGLLQAFFWIRSERLLMEQLGYNLLYRWFVGLGVDQAMSDHSVFSKNPSVCSEADVEAKFSAAISTSPR